MNRRYKLTNKSSSYTLLRIRGEGVGIFRKYLFCFRVHFLHPAVFYFRRSIVIPLILEHRIAENRETGECFAYVVYSAFCVYVLAFPECHQMSHRRVVVHGGANTGDSVIVSPVFGRTLQHTKTHLHNYRCANG